MDKICAIYQIKSKINGKIYIGSALNIINRWRVHLSGFKKGKNSCILLQRHVNKYGIEDLDFSIIELVMFKEYLINREQYYINTLNPEFNICKIAGSSLGRKSSEEAKDKIKKALLGRKFTDEWRLRISAGLRNFHNKETIDISKMDVLLIEKNNKYLNELKTLPIKVEKKRRWHLSKETREKISKSNIGKKYSMESREKIRKAVTGISRIQKHLEYIKENINYKTQYQIAKELGVSQSGICKMLKQCA